ncbi:MAG: hypothetical protein JW849_05285 [Phycisphaerae bacterium]|nr:hypothetical protein [Phycisphaerae bacterium]
MNTSTRLGLAVLTGMLIGSAALAQDGGGALQRKLDEPVRLNLRNTPLPAVFAALSRQSGVRFDVLPDTYRFLPYGEDTRLDVSLPGQSLRETLSNMLAPQGLAWEVHDKDVRIQPAEPLYRIARRATYDELKRIGQLMTARVKKLEKNDVAATLAGAADGTDWKVILPAAWSEKQVEQFGEQFAKAPGGTAADWLDAGCGPKLTWRLDGEKIIILSRKDQVLHQLERRVSLQYKDAPLMTVLLDLARLARVKLLPAPGVMNYLPPTVRKNFTLAVDDASIDQALKVISGSTGLEFPVSAEGIAVRRAADVPIGPIESRGTEPGGAAGVFVQTVIPTSGGRELRVFFVPGDMSTDLQAALEAERRRIVRELEKHFVSPDAPAGKTDGEDKYPPAFIQK